MKFQRPTSSPGSRSRPPANLERKHKAEELSTRSGIPIQMAYSVVDGHTTLDAVLKAMLAREKTRRLIEQHDLPPSLAGQVARGQVPLDKVLARHRRRSSAYWRAKFSVLDELVASHKPIALLRFGQDWTQGHLTGATKYDVTFDAGSGPQELPKHDLKLIVPTPEALATVREALTSEPEVKARGLGATAELTERLKLDKERFYEEVQTGRPMRFVFRDGDVLRGTVAWFARYEFAVRLPGEVEVVGFFHALLEWALEPEPAKPSADGKKQAAEPRPKAHKKDKGKKGRR